MSIERSSSGWQNGKLRKRGLASRSAARLRPGSSFPAPGSKEKAADDQTLVVQFIIARKYRVLLVSDSGPETESVLTRRPNDLRSDILIKGQHYSGESGSAAFLDAVQPQLIVATSVDFPPAKGFLIPGQDGRERGIKLLRQDETGAVTLEIFRDHWRATTLLNHETFCSSSR